MRDMKLSRRPFVLTGLATCGLMTSKLAGQSQDARPLFAYVGTFSSPLRDTLPTQVDLPPGNGRGIHLFSVNRESGALTPIETLELGTSPSCLAVNAAGDRLYSANETARVGTEKHGTISAYTIDRATGKLTQLNSVTSGGAGPTYVSIHPAGKHLFAANYFGGSVAVFPILPNGTLGDATDVKVDAGTIGPTKATNAPPGSFAISGHDRTHAHMIEADHSGKFVLHVDLGLDKIFVWKFDQASGKLLPNDRPYHEVSLPAGDGPRHFHFHPNKRWFYSVQEEGCTIVFFEFQQESGQLTARQTISTLPKGFAGSNFCSEILVSRDGRFVYVGNRLHDSIGQFAIAEDGTLSHVADEWTRGNYPRSFSFDPSGNYLYCCNQRADHVTIFKVNPQSDRLTFTDQYVPVGNPSHIVFVE